ncbi:MAG: phosphatidylglycerophosphatase A [Alphaproteobacteria bacterium]|nr:phosphatidylglycerophosphatase A [Alphaproteobacteria bacterium]
MNKHKIAEFLGTWFYSGKIPFAPGTMGSLVAALMVIPIIHTIGYMGVPLLTIVCFFFGIWSSSIMIEKLGVEDPGQIVIDEVVGMWLTMILFVANYNLLTLYIFTDIIYLPTRHDTILLPSIVTFITFRIFDIWKPFPVSWADNNVKGGLGVMLDDVIAAVYASIAAAFICLGMIHLIR